MTQTNIRRTLQETVAENLSICEGLHCNGCVRANAIILFSDIRGYTTFSEDKDPKIVMSYINDYFELGTGLIVQHGGVIDKYLGDGILAVFGLQTENLKTALPQALSASVAFQQAFMSLVDRWIVSDGSTRNLTMGIGINAGRVIVAQIGPKDDPQVTVFGDVVNTASRMCSFAQGGEIILSDHFQETIEGHLNTVNQRVMFKGKLQPTRILRYKVIPEKNTGVKI